MISDKNFDKLAADQTSHKATPRQAHADKAQTIIYFCLGDLPRQKYNACQP